MENKKQIVVYSSIIAILLVFIISLYVINKVHEKRTVNKMNSIYGTVLSSNNGVTKIETLDDEVVTIITSEDVNDGDLVHVSYYESGNNTVTSVEVIAEADELKTSDVIVTTTTTTTTTTMTTTNKPNSAVKRTTTKTTTTKKVDSDTSIVTYMKDTYNSVDSNTESSLKQGMINIIDFIFYDKEINGIKFKDLTTTAKTKVIYYALLIDEKIDNKFPGYKETISEKYKNFKTYLITEYLDSISQICETTSDNCKEAKEDFQVLKSKLSLTWSNVKDACLSMGTKSIEKISNWYKIWSGKE